jgi:Ca-activated chloride channel homolog
MTPRALGAAAITLGLLSSTAQAGWTNWWLTQDQQAQRALEAGDANKAAQLFTDPRRRAYAETEAKQYDAAAKRLAPFVDPESQYNRGNALARGGDLKAALSAYDAALKQAPAQSALQRDARHNRDLVARQLQDQKQGAKDASKDAGQQQRSDQGKSADQQQGSDHTQGSDDQSKGQDSQSQQPKGQGGQAQQSKAQDSQSQQPKGQDGQAQQASDNSKSGSSQSQGSASAGASSQESKSQPSGSPAGDAKSDAEAASAATARNGAQAPESNARAGQAAEDAQSTARQSSSTDRASASAESPRRNAQVADEVAKPPTEQSLALDQWLRQIPDDPAGLLRRKFLIEHMMKQGAEQ